VSRVWHCDLIDHLSATGVYRQRFLDGDDDFKNGRFKYACRLVKAPWLLSTAVQKLGGERPTIIGRKLSTVCSACIDASCL
jgi:hypothetical protein